MILMLLDFREWMMEDQEMAKASEIEERSTRRKGEKIPLESPIFVTSVPPYDIVRTYWTKCITHKRINNRD